MKKFYLYRVGATVASIASLVVVSGAAHKFA
jgi:hypothetical protein